MSFNYEYDIKYTDNPYIDLIVHLTKNMVMNCVVKNERTALKYETVVSRERSNKLIKYKKGKLYELPDYDESEYVEANNYYRMLQGLPPYPTESELKAYREKYGENADTQSLYEASYISLDPYIYMITSTEYGSPGDTQLISAASFVGHYLHEFRNNETALRILENDGVLAQIEQDFTGSCYSYIYHMGDKVVDSYTARTAPNFALLYVPTSNIGYFNEIYYKFIRTYERNRDYTLSVIYSEAYAFGSIHYDDFIQILILIQTMIDMISEVQEYIINKDVFDSRTIRYLFESYGVDYYKEIPVSYQIRIIKNINLLLKYKSSNKNIEDILLLFDHPDIQVYTYYLMKTKKVTRENMKFYSEDDINPVYLTSTYNTLKKIPNPIPNIVPNTDELYTKILYFTTGVYKNHRAQIYSKSFFYNLNDINTLVNYIDPKDGKEKPYTEIKIVGWVEEGIVRASDRFNDKYESDIEVQLENTPVYKTFDSYEIITEDMLGTEDFNENYDMCFLKVPITDQNISNYIEDKSCRRTYDFITKQDPFWDGVSKVDILTNQERENYHNAKRKEILNTDFSCIRTKYISVDAAIDVTKMSYQVSYFMNILFDKHYDEEMLMLNVDNIISQNKVKLNDLLSLAIALSYVYNGVEPDMIASDMERNMTINGFNFDSDWTTIYNDLNRTGQGFMVELDSDSPGAFLSGRYSESDIWYDMQHHKVVDVFEGYDEYTTNGIDGYNYPSYLGPAIEQDIYPKSNMFEENGLDCHIIDITWDIPYADQNSGANFKNTSELIDLSGDEYTDIDRFNKLKEIYTTNTKLYNHLTYMMRTAESKSMYDIYKTVFESFMETKLCHEFYNIKDLDTGYTVYEDDQNRTYRLVKFDPPIGYKYVCDQDNSIMVGVSLDSNAEYVPADNSIKPKMAKDYYEFLLNRNLDLYAILQKASYGFKNEDEKMAYIANICDSIAHALEQYFDTDEWKYIYNLIPTRDLQSIQKFILQIVIFFKSWKTQMLDQTVQYVIDDPFGNHVHILDDIEGFKILQDLYEKPGPRDYQDWIVQNKYNEKISPYEKISMKSYIGFYNCTELDFLYDVDEEYGYITLVKYITTGYPAIRLPATIEGYPVKYIESTCFTDNDEVTDVIIPEGVIQIG